MSLHRSDNRAYFVLAGTAEPDRVTRPKAVGLARTNLRRLGLSPRIAHRYL